MSYIRDYYTNLCAVANGKFKEMNEAILAEMADIRVESFESVYGKKKAQEVKRFIKPKKNQCYRNAVLLAKYLGGEYCEGAVCVFFPIDHAFVKFEGHYFDPTFEWVLKKDVTAEEYALFHTWGADEAYDKMMAKKMYCDLHRDYLKERLFPSVTENEQ